MADLVGNGLKCSNKFFGFGVKSDHLEYIISEEDQVAGKVGRETNLRKHSFVLLTANESRMRKTGLTLAVVEHVLAKTMEQTTHSLDIARSTIVIIEAAVRDCLSLVFGATRL